MYPFTAANVQMKIYERVISRCILSTNTYFCPMASIRQEKIAKVIQQELSSIFQQNAREYCDGAMVTVTISRVAPDLSFAKNFVSIFGHPKPQQVYELLNEKKSEIRYEMGKRLGKSLRRIPELAFEIDDSLDYAEEINSILDQ